MGLKGYLWGAVALAAIVLATIFFRWFTGIQAENGNLKSAVADYQVQVTALEIEKKSNETLIEALTTAQVMMSDAINTTNENFSAIREQRDRQKRVLEGSRLGRLAAEKADQMEQLSNAATRERFTQFEGVINEDF